MKRWLIKGEPDDYGAAELEREGRTTWDGIRNPTAQQNLRAMTAGDALLVYHSGKEKAIVATARVVKAAYPDPKDKSGKLVAVQIEFDAWLPNPVPLAAIKADPFFADFDLVRISRLSVMPVSGTQWKRVMTMSKRA